MSIFHYRFECILGKLPRVTWEHPFATIISYEPSVRYKTSMRKSMTPGKTWWREIKKKWVDTSAAWSFWLNFYVYIEWIIKLKYIEGIYTTFILNKIVLEDHYHCHLLRSPLLNFRYFFSWPKILILSCRRNLVSGKVCAQSYQHYD